MQLIKRNVKRVLRHIYNRLAKPLFRPIHRRVLDQIAYQLRAELAGPFRNVVQVVQANEDYQKALCESDRLILALMRPPAPTDTHGNVNGITPIALGADRILLGHPTLPFMYADPADKIATPRLLLGSYESGIHAVWRRLIKPGQVIVEASAHQGFHTLTLGHLAAPKGGRVISLEPNPRHFAVLSDNVLAHDLANVVTVLPYAASAATSPENSREIPAEDQAAGKTIRIADLLKQLGLKADLIRLALKGAEPSAIDGMQEMLADNVGIKVLFDFHPRLISERGGSPSEVLRGLGSMGFRFWRIGDDGSMTPHEPSAIMAVQSNIGGTFLASRGRE